MIVRTYFAKLFSKKKIKISLKSCAPKLDHGGCAYVESQLLKISNAYYSFSQRLNHF